ncbi:hypothetical protein BVI434_120028 [Burkholderia vietnamiensis]|nr:hypothetical protein BVI434_120028 [Burkholderia vietnamiensis]
MMFSKEGGPLANRDSGISRIGLSRIIARLHQVVSEMSAWLPFQFGMEREATFVTS